MLAWLLAAALVRALLPAGVMPDLRVGLVLCGADGGVALLGGAAAPGGARTLHDAPACPFAPGAPAAPPPAPAVLIQIAGVEPPPVAVIETHDGRQPPRPRARGPPCRSQSLT